MAVLEIQTGLTHHEAGQCRGLGHTDGAGGANEILKVHGRVGKLRSQSFQGQGQLRHVRVTVLGSIGSRLGDDLL